MSSAQTARPTPLRPAVAMARRGGAARAASAARSGAVSGLGARRALPRSGRRSVSTTRTVPTQPRGGAAAG
eukprot:scaffold45474_cov33-Phaeocystis_antarctica.AAC.1